ncbi:MAG: hypothetical protein L3J82_05655 [Planctomycetes bacterium]|nr:hypothetical protein [Planctomycetota bacterium]
MDRAPRITEGLLGKQDAALRDLLNKFKTGSIDDALKRAMPMNDESGRGAKQAGGTQLPFQNLLYSLGSLMGGGGGATWFTDNSDVYRLLRQEYRKAAENAEAKGDFRRAAYIYGKLLGDFKHAARVLERGGLHHDAAIIYEKKLNDRRAAAKAFEAAGEIDEAIRLFVHIKDWSAAGELYMRHGEDDRAITMFTYAADEHVQAGAHFAAGHVMFSKAHRPDLAKPYLQRGWQRQSTDGVRCGIKLLDVHADAEEFENVDRLISDAERKLTSQGHRIGHSQFFNHVAKLSGSLNQELPDLNDRARTALAGNLQEQVKRGFGKPAGEVFTDKSWSNATISDADYAARHFRKPKLVGKSGKPDSVVSLVRVLDKDVSCFAMSDDTLLLGTYDGQLTTFTPETGPQHHQLSEAPLYDIAGVGGDMYISTIMAGAEINSVRRFYRTIRGGLHESGFVRERDGDSDSNTTDVTLRDKIPISVHVSGNLLAVVPWGQRADYLNMGDWRSILSQVLIANVAGSLKIVCVTGSSLRVANFAQFDQLGPEDQAQAWENLPLHATPRGQIRLTTIAKDCVGFPTVTTNGGLFWTQLAFNPSGPSITNHFIEGGEFTATTYAGVGRIAAIAGDSVHWFKQQGESFVADGFTQANFRNVIGLCWLPKSQEVGVVTRHGEVHLLTK